VPHPLLDVRRFGQSIWYDNIRRSLITSGELARMVANDGLLGVTSNPSIFEKAITSDTDYDEAFERLVASGVGDAKELYERIAVEDIQMAADVLRPAFERSEGCDGFVSLEVSPYLAHDTAATIDEGLRLHAAVSRPNVMIKVPATPEGMPAISALIARGVNVNVTLLFGLEAYQAAARAYLEGLERLTAAGGDPARVASVASFFVSRIDTRVDQRLEERLSQAGSALERARLEGLRGKVAIASARLAYERYRELLAGPRWKALAARGARPQRLLWASTSTKNPAYPKTLYVDELIGADTVNTVPAETLEEFKKTGRPRESLTGGSDARLEEARRTLATLDAVGISLRDVTDFLLADGVAKFAAAFDDLLAAVARKRAALLGARLDGQTAGLGAAGEAVEAALEDWRRGGKVRRLWAGDATLWTGGDEGRWLGWLRVVDEGLAGVQRLAALAEEVRREGFRHVVLLGMGGSSLCPDVLRRTFGVIDGHPELRVLDSTVPEQVKRVADAVDPARALFVVASKSGSTIEPEVMRAFFFDRVSRAVGAARAGRHFLAITDPGTQLDQLAREQGFRAVVYGDPTIGGRFSALSVFGLAPAALLGLDPRDWLERAREMVRSCGAFVPPAANPGVALGAILGSLARQGRDKLTFVASPGIAALGGWLEQLVAESTGKRGRGIVPVDGETLGSPSVYADDRIFVYLRLSGGASATQDAGVSALEAAGHPVARIEVADARNLGQEFFRFEIATAVAGALLGIDAFDQPDVEAAKRAARRLTAAYEETGRLEPESPLLELDGLRLFAAPDARAGLEAAAARGLPGVLAAHLALLRAGDYFALNAFVERCDAHDAELQRMRHAVRDARRVATTLGYGPRFLHSTGQLHKGGPPSGVLLQITADPAEDVAIPGRRTSFGVLALAQARADFDVLVERGRRVLRVHLGSDVPAGLARLRAALERALG
jgi:transaldolase/glucose-6-phosphate isomerase